MIKGCGWLKGIALALAVAGVAWAQAPQVLNIGAQEVLPGGGSGRLSTIATDSSDSPHVVSDGGTYAFFFDKIGGVWNNSGMNMASYGYAQYYVPHIEIDATDRGWISGIIVAGMGTIVRPNITTVGAPGFFSSQVIRFGSWDSGNLSLDPGAPNDAVLMSAYGSWKKVTYDATQPGACRGIGTGTMFGGQDGEKKGFSISRAGNVAHRDGSNHGIWHLAIGGWDGWSSSYQNSVRHAQGAGPVTWAEFAVYSTQKDDGAYVDCVADAKDANVAYMVCDFSVGGRYGGAGGVAMNIWNGTSMVFPATSLLSVDPNGTSGLRRFAPQLAAAKDGGCWLTWTRDNRVKLRYIAADGQMGPEVDVCAGKWSAICTDKQGQIHLAYNNGGICYRKITVTGGSPFGRHLPGNYLGGAKDDLCLYFPAAGLWCIWPDGGAVPGTGTNIQFGWSASKPVPSDFNGNGVDDLCVYWPAGGLWFMWPDGGTGARTSKQFGWSATQPLPGDYDGNGTNDLCVYWPQGGLWFMWADGGTGGRTNLQFGWSACTPVPADYDGNGTNDLAVYWPGGGTWFIWPDGGRAPQRIVIFGNAGEVPVPADYTGNGKTDLAMYNPQTGVWRIWNDGGSVGTPWSPGAFGVPEDAVVPADYFGGPQVDLGRYLPLTGTWNIWTDAGTGGQTNLQFGWSAALPPGFL